MPLHPDDVVRKTFRTAALRRGYDAGDVDAFLEEVVVELHRLRRQVDESQAEIDRLQREITAGASAQLAVQEQQLEQVRREREAVLVELRDADQRIAQVQEEVARAEADRDAQLQEIQARFDEDLSILKRRAHDAREDARQLAEAARLEEEGVIARLATLRAESEEAAAAEIGPDRVAELIAAIEAAHGAGPLADLHVIGALAESVRRDHFERGRAEAEEILAEAAAEREHIVADSTRRAKTLLDTAQSRHDELLQTAHEEHDRLIAEGKRTHDELIQTAQAEHDRLIADGQRAHEDALRSATEERDQMLAEAREERDSILADLTARRDQLQSRVDELDRFQHEYRDRIRGLMADQIRALDAGEWHP